MSESCEETAGRPDGLAAVLHAARAYPGRAEQLNMFGRFVGTWDVEWRGTDRDGRPATMTGELCFGWVLGGHAVQVHLAVDRAVGQRGRRSAAERRFAGRGKGQHGTQAEDVAGGSHLAAFDLLRGHVTG